MVMGTLSVPGPAVITGITRTMRTVPMMMPIIPLPMTTIIMMGMAMAAVLPSQKHFHRQPETLGELVQLVRIESALAAEHQ